MTDNLNGATATSTSADTNTETTGTAKRSGSRASAPGGQSIGELVAKVTAQFSALVRDEITYTKLQGIAKAKKIGVGGVLLGAAGVLALYMLGILLLAAGFALSQFLPMWAAFLVVAGGLFLIIIILALIGALRLKASRKHVIDPQGGLNKDIAAFKKGLDK